MLRQSISWPNLGRLLGSTLLMVASACGGADSVGNPVASSPAANAGSAAIATPSGAAGAAGAKGVSATTEGGGGSRSTAQAPPTAATPTQLSGGVPCEVASVVSNNCTLCHASATRFGSPMPLMTLADFHADAVVTKGKKVFEITPDRINATDIKRRMPPASSAALPAADLATFMTWLQGGAKGVPNSCAITDPMATPTTMPPDPGSGMMPTMPAATGSMGHASIDPIEYDDPDMKCYKFLAHAQGDFTKPYSKSAGQEYINFGFKAPWATDVYSRAIKLAIDPNSKVIHHWLLFKTPSIGDGSISVGIGAHGVGDVLLHGWAPGASPIYLDPDLGMLLEKDMEYNLEVHYYNDTGGPSPDSSGAEVCVTTKKPVHEVALSWVGTDAIAGTSATGTCTPGSNMPIQIIAAQPHMHLKGNHMKVVVNRRDGTHETIHDMPFDFDYQRYYVEDTTLMPGDTLTTTCGYSAPATFGNGTESEMCYFFTMHWPAGAIGGGSLIHGMNTCLN